MYQDFGLPSALEGVLELERGLLRPDPCRRLACCLQQGSKRWRAGRRQDDVQNLQQGMAVVDGPVGLVEEPSAVQQVAQLRAGEPLRGHDR